MAQPIPLELPKRDPREELRARLERAPADHAEAVLAGFEVLQGLHDKGVLELLCGVLGGSDKILEIAVEAANSPEAIRGMRNLLIVAKIFGSIDPELLASAQKAEPPGFWETLRILRSRNMRRLLLMMNVLTEPRP